MKQVRLVIVDAKSLGRRLQALPGKAYRFSCSKGIFQINNPSPVISILRLADASLLGRKPIIMFTWLLFFLPEENLYCAACASPY
ncbi:hypothetical protein KRR40_24685 [Niabella defluvii]|nr:hypothetical protein KRR40_24685 [Niabella sp. I65]